jgi:hypothetical protein
MKKIVMLILVLAFTLSFAGCSSMIYSCSAQTLYDESGTAVQLWVGGGNESFIYEIMQDTDGSLYVNINSAHKHKTKMPVPTGSTFETPEHKSFGIKTAEDWGECLLPAAEGENAYQGQKIVNVYYLDQNAQSPVIVMTDLLNGVVKTNVIKPTETIEGRYFILSDGSGKYDMISAEGTAEEILAAVPDDAALTELTSFSILRLVRDDQGNILKVEGRLLRMDALHTLEDVEYEVFADEDEKSYVVIPTVTGESIYVYFEPADYERSGLVVSPDSVVSSGAIAEPVTEYAAVLPSDIL